MNLTRRTALKGLGLSASSLVLQPLVRQLEAQAAASRQLPLRLVFVLEGNGLSWKHIQPSGISRNEQRLTDREQLVDIPLGDRSLPTALEPVNPWKQLLTVVQGLSSRVTGGVHSRNFGALGVHNSHGTFGTTGTPEGETIDVALGRQLGGVFSQVGLGITEQVSHSVVYNCSAWGKGQPAPTICHPELAYANLFGSVADGAARQDFLARTNMLDFLRDDLKRLERQIAGPEQDKLHRHLEAYEAMSQRQSRLNEIESSLRKHAPVVGDKYKSVVETDRLDAHFDLAAAALIGGLTNVVTLASGAGDPYFNVTFSGLGIDVAKHPIGHGGSYQGRTSDVLSTTIRRFHFELIARLMQKLQAVPEGDGTMLDNTLIVYFSDAGEAHHAQCLEWPLVLLGNLGGKLKSGRYVEYPYWGRPGHQTMGNLFTTLLHAVGAPREYFGVRDPMLPELRGPLPELLA